MGHDYLIERQQSSTASHLSEGKRVRAVYTDVEKKNETVDTFL